ncbi:MAG: multidrug ABC transporter substrate-binding protein [Acidobacteria bacterium]|nr:MAG: multidrug ABC transporter substrate-binding protein [Acidobacteriota bacterium]
MDSSSLLRVALRTLGRNKLRTGLTMLGITIGIGAVICTVAIGEGGSDQIREQLRSLGDNFVWAEAGGRNVNGVRTGTGATKTLTIGDMQAIEQAVPFIKICTPQVDARVQVVYNNQNWNTTYRGVSPEYLPVRRWAVSEGGVFAQDEVNSAANVALLGQTVVGYLFPDEDPVGKTIRVGNLPFRVVGVLSPKGYSATGNDQDDFILIPYSTAQKKVKGVDWLDDIMCAAISPEAIRPARDSITLLLRERHHILPGEMEDFNIRSPEDALKTQEEASNTLTLMLACVASVSLLVGGIGVMNIMLVSVTERTREIGVRLAVGATEADVQFQFLAEAVVLSLLGGVLGVFSGIFAAQALARFFAWPVTIRIETVLVAVAFAAATGIGFGYYPARKAAALDPIEALRYE